MVKWNWNNKLGTITIVNTDDNGQRASYDYSIYSGANCFAVILREWTDKQDGTEGYTYMEYWQDDKAVKDRLAYKDGFIFWYGELAKITLNTYYATAELYRVAKLFTQYTKAKVELFYQEPEQKQ